MFKQAVIYYPKDEKQHSKLKKDIAAFHCAAAVKYMDSLKFDSNQKEIVIDSLLQDIASSAMSYKRT